MKGYYVRLPSTKSN